MKLLAILLFVVAVSADASVDWDNVKPVVEMEGFWDNRDPKLFQSPIKTTRRGGRIVNGDIAAPHQFPYQVALLSTFGTSGTGLCGGSVISATSIVTAAHCSDSTVTQFRIIAGAVNMRVNEPSQQIRIVPASGWTQHPNYSTTTLANDIAVIQFRGEPLTFTNAVQPIALASDVNELFTGESVYVSGFGRFSDSSNESSDVLRFTIKTVITNTACRIRFPFLVQDSTICAIGESGINNSVCNGDSGGPLTVRRQGQSLQVGVVSFGSPLGCERDVPDGYARVSSFFTWVQSTGALA